MLIPSLSSALLILAVASHSADDWLQKMNQSLAEQNFDGQFVHIIDDHMRSIHYRHAKIDDDEFERITQLNGPMAEIIRKNNQLTCIYPGKSPAYIYRAQQPTPFHRTITETKERLSTLYRIELLPGKRVAGLTTVQIAAHPKDTHRLHYQLWLDSKTALLVKSKIRSLSGHSLEQFEFTSINLNPSLTEQDFTLQTTPETQPQIEVHPAEKIPAPLNISWSIGWLPPGFMASDKRVVSSDASDDNRLAMRMYTDGLSSFSVFFEPYVSSEDSAPKSTRQGATLFTSHSVSHPPDHRYTATLVGEIPMNTARQIIESIHILQ